MKRRENPAATEIALFAGSASLALARSTADALGIELAKCEVEPYPDGELHVAVQESVRGRDVYVIQSTHQPVAVHLLELLLLADTCRRAGARSLTAVVPYFGYARQDRRARGREPVGARLIADLLPAGGLQRLIALDLHSPSLEGFFSVGLEHLTAVPLLIEAVRGSVDAKGVVVAPDLGAVKLADRYARALGLPQAVVHKTRLSGVEVAAEGLVGEVKGLAPVIVDDMISTGGTVEAAIKCVLAAGAAPEVTVVASHGLFVGPAADRLGALPIHQLIVSDSVPSPQTPLPIPTHVVALGGLFGEAIRRLQSGESMSDLISHG